jgi:hypothetical protein
MSKYFALFALLASFTTVALAVQKAFSDNLVHTYSIVARDSVIDEDLKRILALK